MYKLFQLKTGEYHKAYAWVNPEGVCFTSREIAPLGFRTAPAGLADGMTIKELKAAGFKKVATKMTQEHLAQGWLCR